MPDRNPKAEAFFHLRDDDVAAVRQAIADLEAGDRGQLFEEFAEEFRKRHNIAS